MARGPARGRRRRAPDHVPPAGRQRLVHVVPRRGLARLQHAAERPRAEFTGRYDQTRADYDRTPIKPVLDGEPIYEDHPVSFDAKKLGHSIAGRRAAAAVLGSVQRRVRPHLRPPLRLADVDARAAKPINNPLMPWDEAIDQPGAAQMQHGRALLESRPFLTRVPDRRRDRRRPRADQRARRRPLPVRRDARRRRHATRWSTPRSAGRSRVRMDAIAGAEGQGVVVQSAHRRRRRRSASSRTPASARSRRPTAAR